MRLKLFKCICMPLLFMLIISCSACVKVNYGTKMEFSFSTETPADSGDEKSLYIESDMEKLILNGDLKIDSGEMAIQVVNSADESIVWSQKFIQDSVFNIELKDLKANSEYLLIIQANQSKKVKLVITTDKKLVIDKEKPEKYSIDR